MLPLVQDVFIPQPRKTQFNLDLSVALKLHCSNGKSIKYDQMTPNHIMPYTAEVQLKIISTRRDKKYSVSLAIK